MTTQNKKRDDELKVWIIVGAIFTIFLLIIDFFYSSVNSMAFAARMFIWIGHAALSLGWIVSIAKVADPAYDDVRKGVVYLCIVLSLVIGIHHALAVEDKQVIEDSEKNKTSALMRSKGWSAHEVYEIIDRLDSIPTTKKRHKVLVFEYGSCDTATFKLIPCTGILRDTFYFPAKALSLL